MIVVVRILFLAAIVIAALFFLLSLFKGKRSIYRRVHGSLVDED